MLNEIAELLFDAVRKQVEKQAGNVQQAGVPGSPPPRLAPMRLQGAPPAPAAQAGRQAPPVQAAPIRRAPPRPAPVVAPAPPPASPLLDAFRGGKGLMAGLVLSQVLAPPAALRPHTAPGDTL